jgi:hypothetical protein
MEIADDQGLLVVNLENCVTSTGMETYVSSILLFVIIYANKLFCDILVLSSHGILTQCLLNTLNVLRKYGFCPV